MAVVLGRKIQCKVERSLVSKNHEVLLEFDFFFEYPRSVIVAQSRLYAALSQARMQPLWVLPGEYSNLNEKKLCEHLWLRYVT